MWHRASLIRSRRTSLPLARWKGCKLHFMAANPVANGTLWRVQAVPRRPPPRRCGLCSSSSPSLPPPPVLLSSEGPVFGQQSEQRAAKGLNALGISKYQTRDVATFSLRRWWTFFYSNTARLGVRNQKTVKTRSEATWWARPGRRRTLSAINGGGPSFHFLHSSKKTKNLRTAQYSGENESADWTLWLKSKSESTASEMYLYYKVQMYSKVTMHLLLHTCWNVKNIYFFQFYFLLKWKRNEQWPQRWGTLKQSPSTLWSTFVFNN